MSRVTVIIPNYNGERFLPACLGALRGEEADVLVVDNGSSDKSLEYLSENHPETRVIEMGRNTGFCAAVNAGVKAAGTEYVLLLNNDTVPRRGFVKNLVEAMDDHGNAFSCASRMLMASKPDVIDGAGDLYNAFGWAIARGKGKNAKKYGAFVKVFSACAGAAIYRRALFIELGMMDEAHFAYLEDLDLGYRARIAGYDNLYAPGAEVLHVGSGSSGSRHNEFKITHSARNNIYIIYKNMPLAQRILNAPLLALGFLIKSLYFQKKGFGELYRKSLKEGFALAKSDAGKKRRIRFEVKNLKNYIKIQLELWANMFTSYG